jgi:hypothetical protein
LSSGFLDKARLSSDRLISGRGRPEKGKGVPMIPVTEVKTKESVRAALHCVLKELRSRRNPSAMLVTIGSYDLEMCIYILVMIDELVSEELADNANAPF